MDYILDPTCRPVLESLARQRTLCAFDFDGTLAPIVAHPRQADLRGNTRGLLARLAALYPCVILSGRSRADLLGKLGALPIRQAIGSHGADAGGTNHQSTPHVGQWKLAIELELGRVPGLWVEDKGRSLAVHYRHSPRRADVQRRILQAARNLDRVRIVGGKYVVNFTIDGDPHKGTALAAERERLGCDWALYVGDDDNDEDAFAIGGNLVAVRIGRRRRTHARYYLRTQDEIDPLIERMVTLREQLSAVIR